MNTRAKIRGCFYKSRNKDGQQSTRSQERVMEQIISQPSGGNILWTPGSQTSSIQNCKTLNSQFVPLCFGIPRIETQTARRLGSGTGTGRKASKSRGQSSTKGNLVQSVNSGGATAELSRSGAGEQELWNSAHSGYGSRVPTGTGWLEGALVAFLVLRQSWDHLPKANLK